MLSPQSQHEISGSAIKSALLDRKIEECTAGLWASITRQLHSLNKDNTATIVKYIEVIKTKSILQIIIEKT
jgi:hypothetical protein